MYPVKYHLKKEICHKGTYSVGGYGLTRKFVWIQIVKKSDPNGNRNSSYEEIDGPINWDQFGTDYVVKKIKNKAGDDDDNMTSHF